MRTSFRFILICLCLILTSCNSLRDYSGPTLRFSIGFDGVEVGVTMTGKKGMTAAELLEKLRAAGVAVDPPSVDAPIQPTK